ncbi:MAG: UDP-2,3-diacylglucosamine pyrophosphatase [Pseudomonadota bacterium]
MKAHSLFISDLHLDASRPAITQAFIAFIQKQASQAERLFILGDWFEYWAGDDDLDDPAHQAIFQAMAQLQQSGCQLYIMHGNRDCPMAIISSRTPDKRYCGSCIHSPTKSY